jgi:2,3-bisphosphoglycerate-independent phosphoglycerate mutase
MVQIPPITHGGREFIRAVQDLYSKGQSDYGLEPIVRVNRLKEPIGRIQDGDAVIFCCRRGEREIELTEAFVEPDFSHFERRFLENLRFVILTLYHEKFSQLPVAFAPSELKNTLGEVISRAGLRQLRVAESEKYAHVTFFLNGGNHQAFDGEVDICVPSPKGVAFDQIPELSLEEVTSQVVNGVEQGFSLIVTNFANGDVIGHTANRQAKIQAARCVDQQLGLVVDSALAAGYVVMLTADHGNLEVLLTQEGQPHVSHTENPVQFVLLDGRAKEDAELQEGCLADIAPTILAAMGVPKPVEMSGHSLAPDYDWGGQRKVLLVILDGWGIGNEDENNPIWLAKTGNWDEIICRYPGSKLLTSGEHVGLQPGKAGNSEAGHLNIGAGRVVLQDDVRLDSALTDGSFFTNKVFLQTFEEVKSRGKNLHLIGLLTEKSSHGSIDYPLALLKMAKIAGLEKVYLHLIFDGRSTEPGSAPALLEKLERQMQEIGVGQIATGIGRGIALDRDGNYVKIKKAYDALTTGIGYCAGDC